MGDIESRLAAVEQDTAVLKAIMPRVEKKIDEHMAETQRSRQATNDKLDTMIQRFDARENQAVGALQMGKGLWGLIAALAAIAGAVGGKVGAAVVRLF